MKMSKPTDVDVLENAADDEVVLGSCDENTSSMNVYSTYPALQISNNGRISPESNSISFPVIECQYILHDIENEFLVSRDDEGNNNNNNNVKSFEHQLESTKHQQEIGTILKTLNSPEENFDSDATNIDFFLSQETQSHLILNKEANINSYRSQGSENDNSDKKNDSEADRSLEHNELYTQKSRKVMEDFLTGDVEVLQKSESNSEEYNADTTHPLPLTKKKYSHRFTRQHLQESNQILQKQKDLLKKVEEKFPKIERQLKERPLSKSSLKHTKSSLEYIQLVLTHIRESLVIEKMKSRNVSFPVREPRIATLKSKVMMFFGRVERLLRITKTQLKKCQPKQERIKEHLEFTSNTDTCKGSSSDEGNSSFSSLESAVLATVGTEAFHDSQVISSFGSSRLQKPSVRASKQNANKESQLAQNNFTESDQNSSSPSLFTQCDEVYDQCDEEIPTIINQPNHCSNITNLMTTTYIDRFPTPSQSSDMTNLAVSLAELSQSLPSYQVSKQKQSTASLGSNFIQDLSNNPITDVFPEISSTQSITNTPSLFSSANASLTQPIISQKIMPPEVRTSTTIGNSSEKLENLLAISINSAQSNKKATASLSSASLCMEKDDFFDTFFEDHECYSFAQSPFTSSHLQRTLKVNESHKSSKKNVSFRPFKHKIPDLKTLLQQKVIEPGEDVLSYNIENKQFTASLLPNGTIRSKGGELFLFPFQWQTALTIGQTPKPSSAKAAVYSKVLYKGKPLLSFVQNSSLTSHCVSEATTDQRSELPTDEHNSGNEAIFDTSMNLHIRLIKDEELIPTFPSLWNEDLNAVQIPEDILENIDNWD